MLSKLAVLKAYCQDPSCAILRCLKKPTKGENYERYVSLRPLRLIFSPFMFCLAWSNGRICSARCCRKRQTRNLRSGRRCLGLHCFSPSPALAQYSTPLPSAAARKQTSTHPCPFSFQSLPRIIQHIFPAATRQIN